VDKSQCICPSPRQWEAWRDVQYHLGGTAVPVSEFTTAPSGNTVTIPYGSSSGTITICAVDDSALVDMDRYVEVTLTNASCCTVDSQPARVTLLDSDLPEVRVFAFPQWVRKPSPTYGTNTAGFYFIRDGDSLDALTVSISLAGAEAGVDYEYLANPFAITFPANVRTNLLPIALKPTTNTADKTLTLTITSTPGYQTDPAAGAATITIASSTLTPLPVVQVTATDDDAREAGLATGTFTFTRAGPTAEPLRVFYRVTGTADAAGTTNSASDYLELPGVVDFAAGVSSVAVSVTPINNDLELEMMETVTVVLSAGDYKVGANNTATVYIDDDAAATYDPVVMRHGIHGVNATRPLYLRVTRFGTALSGATMSWRLTNTFGAQPFVTPSGDVSGNNILWAARQSVANVSFSANWSTHPDTTHNGTLKLNGNAFTLNAPYQSQSALVAIESVTTPATLVSEGSTVSSALRLRRLYPTGNSLTFFYSVSGTAAGDVSVDGGSTSKVIPGGQNQVTIPVEGFGDSQTSGWKTAVVTINEGTSLVAEGGSDHAFVRLQDDQVSNPVFDTDLDNDGLSDGWELDNLADGYDPLESNNAYADTDRDGLQLFEEIQLGTNPDVADAQPVYPSEDPDDYVPLKLVLGARGKLPDLAPANCASCHSAGLRAGMHTRSTPRTTWAHQNNVQDHLIRFLRGSNYPVRLLDNPTAKVLPSSQTNSTSHKYTAAYTAQFLSGADVPYTLVTDTNQLFGTNRAMVLEALGRNATLFIPDMLIAADVDRDGVANSSNRVDRTEANAPFSFWINDDVDARSDDTAEDVDPTAYPADGANSEVDGLRDLEDFVPLHFRVSGLPGHLLTNGAMQMRIFVTNLAGTPSFRIFRAVDAGGGSAYLTNDLGAAYQLAMSVLGRATNGTALTLAGSEWRAAGSNSFFLPTIFEGISTGRCIVTFGIASNAGPVIAMSRPFYLELRRVTELYEHWTVGDNYTTPWNEISKKASPTPDGAVFASPQSTKDLDYILFVHGWRLQPWERRAFASTAYKRLWHSGFIGRFGLFSWPTDWCDSDEIPVNPQNYDRSERRAWHSALGLERLLIHLNRNHPGGVRVMAHSMGNHVTSEALRLKGLNPNRPPILHTYVASQAATVAHAYDAVNPETIDTDSTTQTPETYARYPVTGAPYFAGITNAVRLDANRNIRRIWNFHNQNDFALSPISWDLNQDLKPDVGWNFDGDTKRWRRTLANSEGAGMLEFHFIEHGYAIYAHIAEARSRALGAAEQGGFTVRGQIGDQVNLNGAPFLYGGGAHEHSAQFRSILMHRHSYWSRLLETFEIAP
jgi:hypothetical protein